MTIDRMVDLLKIEHECMLRESHGDCDGRCEDCDLVQDNGDLHEMYENVIGLIENMEPVEPIENAGFYYCGACKYAFTSARQKYCSECGRKVKWE